MPAGFLTLPHDDDEEDNRSGDDPTTEHGETTPGHCHILRPNMRDGNDDEREIREDDEPPLKRRRHPSPPIPFGLEPMMLGIIPQVFAILFEHM